MKNTFLIILIFFCSFLISCSSQVCTANEQKSNILIVADEWPKMQTLAQYLDKTGKYKIDSVHQENIQSDLLEYDYIFMYIHSILSKNAELAFISYANNGGKLIVLHHGIASSKMNNPDWLEFVGIQLYPPNDEDYGWKVLHDTTLTMVNLSPGHFITSNKITYSKIIDFTTDYSNSSDSISGKYQAFDLTNTEIFLNQRFTDSRKKKLLYGFATEDGSIMQPTAGWYQKTGQGWLFYFQAGHKVSDFENENFRQILLNTLEWQPEILSLPWNVNYPDAQSAFEAQKENWQNILPDSCFTKLQELTCPPESAVTEEFKQRKQQWYINNNVLYRDSKQGNSHMISNTTYSDFILHVEWRYLPDLFDRSQSLPVPFYQLTLLIVPRPLLVGQTSGERGPSEEENYAAIRKDIPKSSSYI